MRLSPWHVTRLLTALALCVLGTAPPAWAEGRSKLDKALRERRGTAVSHRVIIQTTPAARAALLKALERHGDVVHEDHPSLNAITAAVHDGDLGALQADPSVLSVSIDAEVTAFGARPDARGGRRREPRTLSPAGLLHETLGASLEPFTGHGTNVAVVDSGIDAGPDLKRNIAGFWDFTRGGVSSRPRDDYGHGTIVAGLIASAGLGSRREFAGVAPGTRLYGFKVLDAEGRGRVSHVVKAIEFIVANKKSTAPGAFKIDIINLSLGHPIYEPAGTDPLVRAVEAAVRAGIVVVTAAGNIGLGRDNEPGYTGITSPGNAPSSITVGAFDTKNTVQRGDDRVAPFSSRGPTWFDAFAKPDLVAPGVKLTADAPPGASLLAAYPQMKRISPGLGTYASMSGTSMAAAVTTGVGALVLEASRRTNAGHALTPNALKAVLQYTALPLSADGGARYDALTQGTGGLNARGALALALAINTRTPPGLPWLRFVPEPHSVLAGSTLAWSQALVWDDTLVRGSDALAFSSAQWLDETVWGTGFDDNIVWGTAAELDNIVWGTATTRWASDLVWADRVLGLRVDGDNIVWGTVFGLEEDNIVWGTWNVENIVWGTWDGDNIVWGTTSIDDIVWGTSSELADNIVWGTEATAGR